MDDNNRIKEQLKEIIEKLEQGIREVFESDKYKAYLNTMSKFYNYSFNNTMLIAMQKPDATLIAGYNAWKDKFDRHVRKGEKGIRIIAPAPIRTKEEAEKLDPITQEPMLDEKGKPIMEEVEITTPSYKVIPVFDVSQTDGKPLPDLEVEELNGDVKDYEIFMEALTQTSPVSIGYEEIPDGVKGYYHLEEKRIAIQEGMSENQTVKTAIHEISHATLHDNDLNLPDAELPEQQKKDRKTNEVEAESIAYTVCQHYGIDTSDYSFGYVAGWSSDKELRELRSSLETIRKTSATLINAIDAKVTELQAAKEQTKEPIHSTDVIVKVTGAMGSEYEVDRVTGLSSSQVQALLEEMTKLDDNSWDGNVQEYLQKNGVEVTPLLSSNGMGEDYPVFYDFDYDTDINMVTSKTELSGISQAENLIHRMEYSQDLFSKEERDLLVNYAYQFADMETVDSLAGDIASEGYGVVHGGIAPHRQAGVDIDYSYLPDSEMSFTERNEYGYTDNNMYPIGIEKALELYDKDLPIMFLYPDNTEGYAEDRAGIEHFEGICGIERKVWEEYKELQDMQQELKEAPLSKEAMLLYGKEDSFGIYQLKHGDELHYHRFESLESLEKHNLSVQKDNYELIYTASLKEGQTLDDIFEEFNLFRPEDFTGHSLSVSDIIMVHKAGENTAQYVDTMGFKEIPDFLEQEQQIEQEITSEATKASTPEQKVKDVDALSFGDVVQLYNGGKSVDIIDEQTIHHASWRKDMKGLDVSTGEMVKFNANEIEAINFSNGSIADRDEDNFISHFYVIEDIEARLYKLTKYEDYPSAREAYFALPFDKKKALGVQNTKGGSLDFIHCKDGDDTPIMDCKKVEGWNNPAIYSLVEQIQLDAILYGEKELAYEFADRYLMLQECDEGYDYTFYDKDYKLMDGGAYDNPDIKLHEALHIILTDDPFSQGERKIIDYRELEEKVDAANAIVPPEKVVDELKQSLTFYVTECSEYPNLGEYHENLTLDEAVQLYVAIPPERMNAGKGIGFTLHSAHEPEDTFVDMQFDILSGKVIDVDIINHIPEFRESALVQQAVKDVIERFPEAKVWDRETREREAQEAAQNFDKDCEVLAVDLDQFSEDYDTYEYNNAVEDKEENVRNIYQWLQSGEVEHIAKWLNEVIEDEEPKEDVEKATELLSRLDDIAERREKNPLTKVEELEEANYNHIDGMLNNPKPKAEEKKEEKLSIMEKLLENKDKIVKQNGFEKVTKEVEKKEISMD